MEGLTRRDVIAGIGAVAGAGAGAGAARAQPTPLSGVNLDLDKAKAEGKVVLYTSLDTRIVDSIIAPFKTRFGIDVSYFRGGSNDVTGKVLAEADADRLQVDVVDASDMASFHLFKQRKLLRAYRVAGADLVDASLRDPDNTWIANRLTQAIIQYNTKELGAAGASLSWKDLAKPEYRNRLGYFSSSNGDGAPRLYALAEGFGWDLLKSFATNRPLRVVSPQLLTQVLESGERAIGFAQNDNIAVRSKTQGRPTGYVFPKEGVPSEPGGIGLIAKSARPTAGALFLEWWMGKEGQTLMAKGAKYSTRSDIPPPDGTPPLSSYKLLHIDYVKYARERPKILDQMAATFGGDWGN